MWVQKENFIDQDDIVNPTTVKYITSENESESESQQFSDQDSDSNPDPGQADASQHTRDKRDYPSDRETASVL